MTLSEVSELSFQRERIREGLCFILGHFKDSFPRTVSTLKTENRQVEVLDEDGALRLYEDAKFIDCRINAYPTFVEYKGINRQPPTLISIDLDRSTFTTDTEVEAALGATLERINQDLSGHPTVLWTGNGYHAYQPLEAFVLEEIELFSKFRNTSFTTDLSTRFMRFSEDRFTNCKHDHNHNPSIKSCMLRIPGSHNSKCLAKNNGVADLSTEVKIIQRWDGVKPRIDLLLGVFYAYLVERKLKDTVTCKNAPSTGTRIRWIENLLLTPIDDHRKNAVNLILAPYLINRRRLSSEMAIAIIADWLQKCGNLRRLDSNFDYLT